MDNKIVLRFCIWGFEDITHDEISTTLGLKPVKTYSKGERKNPKSSSLAKENGWLLQPTNDSHLPFEEQFELLTDIIEKKRDSFYLFCRKYYCEISCAVFIYYENGESTPSVHLSASHNNILKGLDIDFDVDIYCLSND